jgi:hypothetical protein
MKQPRKYRHRAQQYRVLAKGYSALKSRLARPAEGAAEAFEQIADQASQAPDGNTTKDDEHQAGRHL